MYLMMLATRRGLAYVLRERKMAFPPTRPIRLRVGDGLLLYTSRGIFGNPNRDPGRVVGVAEVMSPVLPFQEELLIAGRVYASGCDLKLTGLAPLGEGIILADIVGELAVFQPNPSTWGIHMRRSVLPLPSQDAELILARLKPLLCGPDETAGAYMELAGRSPKAR